MKTVFYMFAPICLALREIIGVYYKVIIKKTVDGESKQKYCEQQSKAPPDHKINTSLYLFVYAHLMLLALSFYSLLE